MSASLPGYSEATVLELVGLIYDAAIESSLWPRFLEKFAETIHAGTTSLLWYDFSRLHGSVSSSVRSDPMVINDYEKYYCSMDVWADGWRHSSKSGMVVLGEQLCPEEKMVRSEFYNDFMTRFDAHHAVGGCILRDSDSMGAVSALRSKDLGSFQEELQLFQVLMPHLERALRIHQRIFQLQNRMDAATDAFDRLPVAILIVNREGRIILANAMAQGILKDRDGLCTINGVISTSRNRDSRKLEKAIHEAAKTFRENGTHPGDTVGVDRPSLRRPYVVLVTPRPREGLKVHQNDGEAILFITDPEARTEVSAEALERIFNLTPSEGKLAALLATGRSIEDVADELLITRQTARTHVKRIFEKTSTHRQGQLIRLLLTSVPQLRSR